MSAEEPNSAGTSNEDPKQPTGDEVFYLVKEVTERMDRLGIAGMIEVRWMTHVAGAGSVTMRGKSDLWIKSDGQSKP